MALFQSLLYFVIAGLCEIGGGYLVWLWLRAGKGFPVAMLGWLLLISNSKFQLTDIHFASTRNEVTGFQPLRPASQIWP